MSLSLRLAFSVLIQTTEGLPVCSLNCDRHQFVRLRGELLLVAMPEEGTGIRELMRGTATISQGNQELLVVRDKVGRPPGELGVSKSMECDIFPSVF